MGDNLSHATDCKKPGGQVKGAGKNCGDYSQQGAADRLHKEAAMTNRRQFHLRAVTAVCGAVMCVCLLFFAGGAVSVPVTAMAPVREISVKTFGAAGDGKTDDTKAFQSAINLAAGKLPLWVPAGDYVVDTLKCPGPWLTIFGDGMRASTLVSKSGKDILVLGMPQSANLPNIWPVVIHDIGFKGNRTASNTGRGLAIQNAYGVSVSNVYAVNCGGDAVDLEDTTYSAKLDNVLAGFGGGCGFKIVGGPGVSLVNCYALTSDNGHPGYWLYSGVISMVGCNGIMEPGDVWGRVGASTLDGQGWVTEADVTLTGCNLETFKIAGLQVRQGSRVSVIGPNQFLAATPTPGAPEPVAVKFEDGTSAGHSYVDQGAGFTLRAAPMAVPFTGGQPRK